MLSKHRYKTKILSEAKNKIKTISKNKKDIKNNKLFFSIYSQLINTQIGINNKLNIINPNEIPSIPKRASLLKNKIFVWNWKPKKSFSK